MAQALVRFLAAQGTLCDGRRCRSSPASGRSSVTATSPGVGEALYRHRAALPTYRAHNEQAMAHAAIAFAKANFRRRMMACTTSIGPGATNLVTAAATAHVNRLPVLFLPGDVFVSRAPDPVLQQIEDFHDGGVSANDCFKPVSRYFDRIVAPSQLLTALPRAIAVLTDPAQCGPVTLALPQDVQAEAYDYPEAFFAPTLVRIRAPLPEPAELDVAAALLRAAKQPVIVAGGGVLYSDGGAEALRGFAEAHRVPVAETQAGKSALPWDHPLQAGPIGVTGGDGGERARAATPISCSPSARGCQDFTTGSHSLFPQAKLVAINVNAFDALKWRATAVLGDAARDARRACRRGCRAGRAARRGRRRRSAKREAWRDTVSAIVGVREVEPPALPYDGEVIGAVQRTHPQSAEHDIVVCAAGTLPAELHKLWRARAPGGYHMEYGYSCMGYEIAGGIGVKMAHPDREVVVMVGDGSYLMLNSEIATSVMLGTKLVIVVLDNRGYGCIHRLQRPSGGEGFNNLFDDCVQGSPGMPEIDFAAHARSLGALAEHVDSIAELEAALARARAADRTYVVVIDTDPLRSTEAGGWWWEVGVPEVSESDKVRAARDRVRARQAAPATMSRDPT